MKLYHSFAITKFMFPPPRTLQSQVTEVSILGQTFILSFEFLYDHLGIPLECSAAQLKSCIKAVYLLCVRF